MKKALLILISLLYFIPSYAQPGFGYRVSFKNKNGTLTFSDSLQFLSQKALDRRSKQGIMLDSTDLPVVQMYIDSVMNVSTAVKLHNVSKWFNQIVVMTYDSTKQADIEALPFVQKVELVARYGNYSPRPGHNATPSMTGKLEKIQPLQQKTTGTAAYYGVAFQQINIMNGDYLHDQGFWGDGMTIAILDAGFKYSDVHAAFDSMRNSNRILATQNFVKDTSSVYTANSDHGSNVLGCIGTEWPGTYVGTAPKANFYLIVTEDVQSEKPIEEDNWVSGAEWADSAGVDIINSSLGYNEYVNPTWNYNYATDFDGKTTLSARAANFASAKGVFVAVAMGNTGASAWHYMLTPGDADSAYTVGMVDGSGAWGGSGYGPSADAQVKPDGMALGKGALLIGSSGQPGVSNGSSFACPILAGSAACLWQVFPSLKEYELRELIRKVSDLYTTPNNTHGYGIPDFKKAYNINLGIDEFENGSEDITIYPNPAKEEFSVQVKQTMLPYSVTIYDMQGRRLFEENNIRSLVYHNAYIQNFTKGYYVVEVENAKQQKVQSQLLIK